MKNRHRVVVLVVHANAHHVVRVPHDSGVYCHRQQSGLSAGAGQCCPESDRRYPESHILTVSSFYRTPPLGPQDQPDYLNAAVALETSLAPEELLNHTQRIELQQGRVRKAERWGPRTLDLDIMLFGNEVINTERLTVPHYDMKNRGFMLWPLFEIAPELVFPDGEMLRQIYIQEHLTN